MDENKKDITIVWIRHAESMVNADYDNYHYKADPTLSPKGITQATNLALELKEVDYVMVSKLKRTQQTATLALPNVSMFISKNCHEWIFGPPEMTEEEFTRLQEAKENKIWYAETGKELHERCQRCYQEIEEFVTLRPSIKRLAIISHLHFIRAFTGATLGNAAIHTMELVKPIVQLPSYQYHYQFQITDIDLSNRLMFGTTSSGRFLCIVLIKLLPTITFQKDDWYKFEAEIEEISYRFPSISEKPTTQFVLDVARLIHCPK